MKTLITVLFLFTLFFGNGQTIDPPIAIYNQQSISWCQTGEINFYWDYCGVNPDNDGTIDWTLVSASFSMGDGTVIQQTTSSNPVTHDYNTLGIVNITATATFINNNNGNTVTIPILACVDPTITEASYLCQDPTIPTENFIEVEVEQIIPSLHIENNNGSVDFVSNTSLTPVTAPTSDWSYELKVDNNVEATGSGIPSYGTTILNNLSLAEGQYNAELTFQRYINDADVCSESVFETFEVTIEDTCTTCNSFQPMPGKRYWVSAWVKEDQPTQVKTYDKTLVQLNFDDGSNQTNVVFTPTGEIIDGWQRIVGSFEIPNGTINLGIELVNNNSTINAFFGDIRIHPYNGSMKSYVYDPETLWLTAELDDNNYATFYEYDKEGKLIRIKKETSRGIMTIQESRSRTLKKSLNGSN